MKARFIAPASLELNEAVEYYDHQLPGLDYRFFQETAAAVERILFIPEAWPKVGDQTRRCMLKGFPYALFYVRDEEEILITAVAHLHRAGITCTIVIRSNNLPSVFGINIIIGGKFSLLMGNRWKAFQMLILLGIFGDDRW